MCHFFPQVLFPPVSQFLLLFFSVQLLLLPTSADYHQHTTTIKSAESTTTTTAFFVFYTVAFFFFLSFFYILAAVVDTLLRGLLLLATALVISTVRSCHPLRWFFVHRRRRQCSLLVCHCLSCACVIGFTATLKFSLFQRLLLLSFLLLFIFVSISISLPIYLHSFQSVTCIRNRLKCLAGFSVSGRRREGVCRFLVLLVPSSLCSRPPIIWQCASVPQFSYSLLFFASLKFCVSSQDSSLNYHKISALSPYLVTCSRRRRPVLLLLLPLMLTHLLIKMKMKMMAITKMIIRWPTETKLQRRLSPLQNNFHQLCQRSPLTISKFKILALFDWCLKRSRLSTAAESSQHARTGATTSSSSSSSLREGRGVGRARGPEVAAAVATEALLVPGAAAVAVVAAAAAATSAAGGGRDQLHWTELVWETVGGGLQRSPPSSAHHLRASRTASATSSSSSSHQRHFYHHQQDYVSEEINCGVAPVCTIFWF